MSYKKLPDALKRRVTNILRTSVHKQLFGSLGTANAGYCAWGAILAGFGLDDTQMRGSNTLREALPVNAANAFNEETQNAIMTLNDASKNSFAQIADWIECNL